MVLYISTELRSVYRLNGETLEYAPIAKDNTFDVEAFDFVEPDLVGSELVTFLGKVTNFYEVYKIVTKTLRTAKDKVQVA